MAITNPYYEFTPQFAPGTKAKSDEVNQQFLAVQSAFDFFPATVDGIKTDSIVLAPESGSSNSYIVTMPDTRTSNQDGDGIMFFATHTNTGSTTLEVDGLGAVALRDWDGSVLTGGEIVSGRFYEVRYDATNGWFVISGNTDAAVKVTYAQEWAAKAEDSLISVAAGGNGTSDYSALHWAAKSQASAIRGVVNTDINTATPPTSEAVSGTYDIRDADNTDLLGWFGYGGSSSLEVVNLMRGGSLLISATNAAGTTKTPITIWPNTNQVVLPLDNDATSPTLGFGGGDTGFYESVDNTLNFSSGGVLSWYTNAAYLLTTLSTNRATIVNENPSSTNPVFVPGGRDDLDTGIGWNSADILSLIAGGLEVAQVKNAATVKQVILPLQNNAAAPSWAFGDGDSGIYESADDVLGLAIAGANKFSWDTNGFYTNNTDGPMMRDVAPSTVVPSLVPSKSDLDTGIGRNGANVLALIAGGSPGMLITHEGSSDFVNFRTNTGATAHVGSSQGDGPIVETVNVYSTVATTGDAATLPATFPFGTLIFIKNDGANSMDVFPASGDDAGAGANVAVPVAAGAFAVFLATNANTTWTKLMGGTA